MFNLSQIKRVHQHFMAELSRQIDQVTDARKLTTVAQRAITDNHDITARTGNLTRKTKARVMRTSNGRLIKIVNTARHAAAQDGGSGKYGPKRRPYLIRPKRAKALRFQGSSGEVFARGVMHPGVKPTRFLFHATNATGRTLNGWLVTALTRAAQKFR